MHLSKSGSSMSGNFFAALDEVFGLPLTHLTPTQRDHLWRRAVTQ
jgi:hypothetical protein